MSGAHGRVRRSRLSSDPPTRPASDSPHPVRRPCSEGRLQGVTRGRQSGEQFQAACFTSRSWCTDVTVPRERCRRRRLSRATSRASAIRRSCVPRRLVCRDIDWPPCSGEGGGSLITETSAKTSLLRYHIVTSWLDRSTSERSPQAQTDRQTGRARDRQRADHQHETTSWMALLGHAGSHSVAPALSRSGELEFAIWRGGPPPERREPRATRLRSSN